MKEWGTVSKADSLETTPITENLRIPNGNFLRDQLNPSSQHLEAKGEMPRKHLTLQHKPFRSELQHFCGELGISGRTQADNVYSSDATICPHSFPA